MKSSRKAFVFGFATLGVLLSTVVQSTGFADAVSGVSDESDSPLHSREWLESEKRSAQKTFQQRRNLEGILNLSKQRFVTRSRSQSPRVFPSDPSRLTQADLQASIEGIAEGLRNGDVLVGPSKDPSDGFSSGLSTLPNTRCSEEVGSEYGLDMQYRRRRKWADGSLVRNVDFPLRRHLGCIRNQGSRGTCTAFASTAALETLVHQKHGYFVNLSEQHLYFWGYGNVDPDSSEGLPTEKTLQALIDENYHAVFENGWQYNPSFYRNDELEDGELDGTFDRVCVGYTESRGSVSSQGGEYCSETIHQGRQEIIRETVSAGGSEFTLTKRLFYAPETAIATSHHLGFGLQIWNEDRPDSSLELAKALLESGVPLVFGGGVTESFIRNDADGFVPYVRNEEGLGGHAMLVVGWVSNSDLPSGAPAGHGGGYFIFRNSWGMSADHSDLGYYYAPYSYLKERTAGLTAVSLD